MAQPHEYVGTGEQPAVANESYEESYQAEPFTCYAGTELEPDEGKWVPGCSQVYERNIWHRFYDDTGVGTTSASTSGIHTIRSLTINPQPHVEYGRIGAN